MSDFLARVARRAAGPGSVARLRPRARFERSGSAPVLPATDVVPRARPRAAAAVPPDAIGRQGAGPERASDSVERLTTTALPPVQAAARRPVAARSVARQPGSPEAVPEDAADAAAAAAPAAPAPRRAPDAHPGLARAAGRQVSRGDLDARALSTPPRPRADGRTELSAEVPATDDLLARHVVPALVEAGLLADTDVSIVREPASASTSAPVPGARPVVRVVEEPPRSRSGGDVHVHIARVEVVNTGPRPSAPARARAPRPPAVDHEAYLAARRGERS